MSKEYDRKEMIAEATDYGLEFKGNISNKDLAELIANFKGEPEPLDEVAPPGPKVKTEDAVDEEVIESAKEVKARQMQDQFAAKRREVARIKRDAFKTTVVTVTNRDSRENEHTTTVYACVANKYFTLAKIVPLDEPVELEQCLINNIKTVQMTRHQDEFVDGKRTGNKISSRVAKYTISYSETQPD